MDQAISMNHTTFIWVAIGLSAVALVGIGALNYEAWQKRRRTLDPRSLPWSSRIAWAVALFSGLTGPLVILFAPLGFVLGTREKNRIESGDIPKRSAVAARTAIQTSVSWIVTYMIVTLLLWWGTR